MHDRRDSNRDEAAEMNRRGFLEAGAGGLAAAAILGQVRPRRPRRRRKPPLAVLPKRTLGQTGVDVTILNLGTWKSRGLDRMLRFGWASGIRYFDTAKSYGSEPAIAGWLQAIPEVRKEIFLVTKDHPNYAERPDRALDQRLAPLKTDYLDLFFIHGIGGNIATESTGPRARSSRRRSRRSRSRARRVRRLLVPRRAQGRDPPDRGGRGLRRRDHGRVHPLARQGSPAEPGARRLPQEGHRPDLDEADRRQHEPNEIARTAAGAEGEGPRPTRACSTRSGATSGSPRAASRCGTPTSSARTRRRRGPSSR